jgi:hypothetical protein
MKTSARRCTALELCLGLGLSLQMLHDLVPAADDDPLLPLAAAALLFAGASVAWAVSRRPATYRFRPLAAPPRAANAFSRHRQE